jgi:uncharacterized membrane protein
VYATRVKSTALLYAMGCALSLASADFFLKLSSTRISKSLGTLVYAMTAAVLAAVWVAWSGLSGTPFNITRSGVFANMVVGASFMLVVACLSGLFATGANLSVMVPVVRLMGIVLAALLGIVVLGEPITWRYGVGALLTLAGVYFIVTR